jgi:hypothetical protein
MRRQMGGQNEGGADHAIAGKMVFRQPGTAKPQFLGILHLFGSLGDYLLRVSAFRPRDMGEKSESHMLLFIEDAFPMGAHTCQYKMSFVRSSRK